MKISEIKRALISVSNKEGILSLVDTLQNLGIEIIATDGTYSYLNKHQIKVRKVHDLTSFNEILDGRVKTLHPAIHGGILFKRMNEKHISELLEHKIQSIDLVCINLYPFEEIVGQTDCKFEQAIENIDIGGPTMIRAAAKNFNDVVVLTSPSQYSTLINYLSSAEEISSEYLLKLSYEAFTHTAYYDSIISNYLSTKFEKIENFPSKKVIALNLKQNLRYGENPHQQAAFYENVDKKDSLISNFIKLQGKDLSYNNIVDADAALECLKQFTLPTTVIIKHANPSSVASDININSSFIKALKSDPVSIFGGIVAFNRPIDEELSKRLTEIFLEVIIAPHFEEIALKILAKKPNLRLLKVKVDPNTDKYDYKKVGGGMLIQDVDNKILNFNECIVVSDKHPSQEMINDLIFAWSVARFAKSNSIVLAQNQQTLGVGTGQTSRIDASKIAINKAHQFNLDLKNSVCASEAFFPFRDNIDLLSDSGIVGFIQPGGSIKDKEIIDTVNEKNAVMLFTNFRTFKH